MARLTRVFNTEEESYVNIGRRHFPLVAGDKLVMLMDLNSKGLCIDSPQIRGRELEEFTRKFNLLTDEERRQSLEIDNNAFVSVLNQCVQCVGCRRHVERLFERLTITGHPTLDPLVLRDTCILSINEEKLKTPQALGTLLYRHHEVLNNLLDNKLRNKTRCVLHSLDAFRAKPFAETWREVWSAMKIDCRDELTVIETKELHDVLDNYLKKHKFCTGCRTKIEKAYKILVGEINTKEKGFVAALYANIKKCVADQHIHVSTNKIDFLDALIKRAEPEVNGSYSKLRERHAKTLEIAQEEVLTCIGMIMYERLRRIYVSLREEERACQVLAAVGVHALCRSFDTFVEKKQGISNLELLYQEISRAEKAKELKREQKKLKKKRKKNEKKIQLMYRAYENVVKEALAAEQNNVRINNDHDDDDDDEEEEEDPEHDEAVELCDNVAYADDELDQEDEEHDDLDDVDDDDEEEKHCAINVPSVAADEVMLHTQNVQATNKQTKKSKKQKQQVQQEPKKKKKQKSTVTNANQQQQQQQLKKTKRTQEQLTHIRRNSCSSISKNVAVDEKCTDCLAPTTDCPCEHDVRDSGYGSEPTSHANSRTSSVASSSSSEGSEVSCSEGLCNHEHEDYDAANVDESFTTHELLFSQQLLLQPQPSLSQQKFSLLQMWDDFNDYDCKGDDEHCYIPQEVVLEYQCQHEKVQLQRQQLRATLRENFERLCHERGVLVTSSNCH